MPSPTRKRPGNSILVPIDGSAASARALERAIDQARPANAQVHVLHVEHPFDSYGAAGAMILAKGHRERTLDHAQRVLTPAVKRLRQARVAHEQHIAWGDPAEVIAGTSRTLRCASIVMATRGMTAIRNLLMGATAIKVVHLADVPVTLVK